MAELSGEDASLDAATARIMGKMSGILSADEPIDRRENRTDRDVIEREEISEVDEGAERLKADEAETTSEEAEGAEDAAQFLEIPRGEGEEPEKVPLSEAMEAVKQFRQFQGDMATALIRVENEAQAKHAEAYNALIGYHDQVLESAKAALAIMPRPQQPSRLLLDRNSGYYNPEEYHLQQLEYEEGVKAFRHVQEEAKKAEEGRNAVMLKAIQENATRENERLARFIPDWGDDAKRADVQKGMMDWLKSKFAFDDHLIESVPFDHRLMRLVDYARKADQTAAKAPEVRKEVQSKAPKIVNGRVSQQRAPDGRFVGDARKALKETGSEEAFATYLLRTGALKNL